MPDTEDADIAAVTAAYDAFSRGDIDGAVADLAVDVEWIEPEAFPDGGRHLGREAVRRYLQRSHDAWRERSSSVTVSRCGERIIARHHVTGTLLDGSRRDVVVADVYTFDEGRVVRMQAYADPDQVPD